MFSFYLLALGIVQAHNLPSSNIQIEFDTVVVDEQVIDYVIQYTISEFDKYFHKNDSQKLINEYKLAIYFSQMYYGEYPDTCPIEDKVKAKRLCRGFYCETGDTGWCLGYFSALIHKIVIADLSTCVANSSIVHEMLHVLHQISFDDSIPDHDNRKIFAAGCTPYGPEQRECYANSMERRIERALRERFCKESK